MHEESLNSGTVEGFITNPTWARSTVIYSQAIKSLRLVLRFSGGGGADATPGPAQVLTLALVLFSHYDIHFRRLFIFLITIIFKRIGIDCSPATGLCSLFKIIVN